MGSLGLSFVRLSQGFLLILLLCSGAMASGPPSEVAVQAAFLPKFAAYVGWPSAVHPSADAPFYLCVVGDDPFGRMLDDATRGQQVDQHPIMVRRLGGADPIAGCHLAFVRGKDGKSTTALLNGLKERPVLTITDGRAGSQRGVIHFVVQEGRVRFHIDEAAAARRGLKINSRLLGIALSVKRN